MLRLCLLWLLFLAAPAFAQEQQPSAVLVIDLERAYSASLYGQRAKAELNIAGQALIEENERIAADLEAEESDLTVRRPNMEPAVFRAEAAEFDARVQQIRQEQDRKGKALKQAFADERDRFLVSAAPVLKKIMIERGASVVLSVSSQAVLMAIDGVDITVPAVTAIDNAIGDGTSLPSLVPEPTAN